MSNIVFTGIIKKAVGKVTASNDREYQLTIVTEDPEAMKAALLPTDATVKIQIS